MSSFEELKLQVPGKIVPLWFSTGGATHTGPERASGRSHTHWSRASERRGTGSGGGSGNAG
jgi:hypothetical protein